MRYGAIFGSCSGNAGLKYSNMTLTFQKPPLNEVALGYSFLPRPDLLIPHIGAFWTKLQDSYPKCQHNVPIVDNPTTFTELPLPRVWLLTEDGTRLVQIQQDRLIFNWRDNGTGCEYVRFPNIKAEFDRVSTLFKAFVQEVTGQPIIPTILNLTYVNIINQGQGWNSLDEIGVVFPALSHDVRLKSMKSATLAEWRVNYELPNDQGKLTARVQTAKQVKDSAPLFRFELAATSNSLGEHETDHEVWIESAHQAIVNTFKDLTSAEMHERYWLIQKGEN